MNNIEEKKKLSHSIERTDVEGFRCHYTYKFSTNQWLESIDNYDYFGIDHNSIKRLFIDGLVSEFKFALNSAIFGDPAGPKCDKCDNFLGEENKCLICNNG